ncbi:MAG: hypothetical protein V3V14_03570, partial [Saprospiraceae bacterium]
MATFTQKSFQRRHIGISDSDLKEMLNTIGVDSIEKLIDLTIPEDIRSTSEMNIPMSITEFEYLNDVKTIAQKNKL